MNNNDRNNSITKSASSNSLNEQIGFETLPLTSTKNPEVIKPTHIKTNRRKSIMPTPHRTKDTQEPDKIINLPTEANTLFNNQQLKVNDICKDVDNKSRFDLNKIVDNIAHRVSQINVVDEGDSHSQSEENEDNDNFDNFILQNFVPFAGKQNVVVWLDETENKFNQLRISRKLRFDAISLLVVGDAKRAYIHNRKSIQCFDDFYEFLLLQFGVIDTSVTQFHPRQSNDKNSSNKYLPCSNTASNIHNETVPNSSNSIHPASQTSTSNSTIKVDLGATNSFGEIPDTKATINMSNSSSSELDHTINDLRRAIVGDLIKNPKTFKGSKDDVKKWIEEIEHLLEVAHIPDSTRLDIISYSLRGDALQWYKSNKSMFKSWDNFVIEIKKAFTSTFHEELAFKTLESYSQGENQSVRNFFNEVLKLCKEVDSSMSESIKLKNLLKKIKPSIQLEVRKKKPTSTAEFLEYAKEVEELFQLSNIIVDNNNNNNSNTCKYQQFPITSNYSLSTNSNSNLPNISSTKFSSGDYRNSNNNRNSYINRNIRYNPVSSSFTPNSFHSPQYSQTRTNNYNQRFQQNRYRPSYTTNSYNNNQKYTPAYQNNSSYNNNKQQPCSANTVFPTDSPADTNIEEESLSPSFCTVCNQPGHEAMACPSF
ncbi:unnamed protein product [Rotaria magnacalcarata]|uniref:Ty3 transposon capsid-like protein domain-containing protein n=4 Tax=Rotaria magnacalcarata TaxID=392030 RepID=A0A816QH05_9BILA|nr:unnamed protein product [Rotaria magnacalcarata]CAF4181605.1 unnamed protein product [Rotaria magnacalcarata]